MDLEQDDWVDNEDSDSMSLDGNQHTYSININRCIHKCIYSQTDFLHRLCVFHHRTRGGARLFQEGNDVLLRPGAEKRPAAECRREGGAAEEAHRHHRGASMEEHRQRQRPHPPVCVCLLSRLFRLKKLESKCSRRLSSEFKWIRQDTNVIYDNMNCFPQLSKIRQCTCRAFYTAAITIHTVQLCSTELFQDIKCIFIMFMTVSNPKKGISFFFLVIFYSKPIL